MKSILSIAVAGLYSFCIFCIGVRVHLRLESAVSSRLLVEPLPVRFVGYLASSRYLCDSAAFIDVL